MFILNSCSVGLSVLLLVLVGQCLVFLLVYQLFWGLFFSYGFILGDSKLHAGNT